MLPFTTRACWACFLAAVMISLAGCGSKPPPKKTQGQSAVPRVPTPQRHVDATPEEPEQEKPAAPPQPAEKIPVGAWMKFSVAGGEPFECRGFLKLHVTGGAENVLELANYDAAHHEDSPSLYIRALTPAKSLAELVNKKIAASIHIQVDETGHMIHNQSNQPLELVITEIDGKNVRGTFTGHAHDVALGGDGSINGKFQAVLE